MAGNVAKKTITMTTPTTAMQFGVYKPAAAYSLPTGFNCSNSSTYPSGIGAKDGAVLSSANLQDGYANPYPSPSPFGGSTYTGWTTLNGYAPMVSANFLGDLYGGNQGFSGQAMTLVPLNATAFSFESSGGGVSGSSGSGSFSIVTGYTGTVTVTKTTPMTVNVSVSMKCNINNAGFITGTPVTFDLEYATVPIAISSGSFMYSNSIGSTVQLYGSVQTNSKSPVTYLWTLTSKPAGSVAALSSTTSPQPTFTADVAGDYVVTLVVNDGTASSAPSTVTFTPY
jgi:hypothetical protein